MKSLNSVQDHHIGSDSYELPVTPDSEFIVDDSNFAPMSEAVKKLGATPFDGDSVKSNYDFADGKDDGSEVPFHRKADVKDIAEISTHIHEKQTEIVDEIKKAADFEKFKAETEAKMRSGSQAASPNTSGE